MSLERLKLYFKDETNHSKSLTVDNPKSAITDREVGEIMDEMISSKVLATKYGPATSKQRAEKEIISKTIYEI